MKRAHEPAVDPYAARVLELEAVPGWALLAERRARTPVNLVQREQSVKIVLDALAKWLWYNRPSFVWTRKARGALQWVGDEAVDGLTVYHASYKLRPDTFDTLRTELDIGGAADVPWPILQVADYNVLVVALIDLDPASQGQGVGGRVLATLERAWNFRRLMVMATHIHRPFFFLVANRHGWNIIRAARDADADDVDAEKPALQLWTGRHDNGADDLLRATTFAPLIGTSNPADLDGRTSHAYFLSPLGAVRALAKTAQRRGTLGKGDIFSIALFKEAFEDLEKMLISKGAGVVMRFPGYDEQWHIALESVENDAPLAAYLRALDPAVDPVAIVIGRGLPSKHTTKDVTMKAYMSGFVVALGRITWRPVYVSTELGWDLDDDLRWGSLPLGDNDVHEFLGARPAWEPRHLLREDNDVMYWRWVPRKRQRYNRATDVFAEALDEPSSVGLLDAPQSSESAPKRPRLASCLQCGQVAESRRHMATDGLFLYCNVNCYRDYFIPDTS